MAFGLADVGGVMDRPVTDSVVGYDDWATMSGVSPGHPLVGGSSGMPGYGSHASRVVAVGAPGAQSSAPTRAHWSELFNFKGNPIGWVAVAAVLYLGLMHIHVHGAAGAAFGLGKGKR